MWGLLAVATRSSPTCHFRHGSAGGVCGPRSPSADLHTTCSAILLLREAFFRASACSPPRRPGWAFPNARASAPLGSWASPRRSSGSSTATALAAAAVAAHLPLLPPQAVPAHHTPLVTAGTVPVRSPRPIDSRSMMPKTGCEQQRQVSGSCVWAAAHQSVCRAWLRCNAGAAPTWPCLASVHAGAIEIHLQPAGAAPVASAGQAPQQQQQQQQQQQHAEQRQQPLKPASRGFSQPLSDIYELSSSSEDEGDAPLPAARLAPAPAAAKRVAGPAGPADAPRLAAKPAPTAAAANGPHAADCPICGGSLVGLSLEQQQRHINACCDSAAQGGSAKPAAAGLKPGWQTDRQVAEHEQDTIPAYRPCFQQEQQPPAAIQQQQPHGARQLAGAAAAKTAVAGAGRQPLQPAAVANEPQLQPPEQPAQQQLCKVCGAELSHLRVQQQVSHVKACMAGRGGKLAQQQQQQQQQQTKAGKRQAPQPQPDAQPAKRPAQQQQQQHAALVPPHPPVPPPPPPQQQQRQQQQQWRLPAVAPAAAAAPAPTSNLQEMSIGQWLQVCAASAVSKASSVWMQWHTHLVALRPP